MSMAAQDTTTRDSGTSTGVSFRTTSRSTMTAGVKAGTQDVSFGTVPYDSMRKKRFTVPEERPRLAAQAEGRETLRILDGGGSNRPGSRPGVNTSSLAPRLNRSDAASDSARKEWEAQLEGADCRQRGHGGRECIGRNEAGPLAGLRTSTCRRSALRHAPRSWRYARKSKSSPQAGTFASRRERASDGPVFACAATRAELIDARPGPGSDTSVVPGGDAFSARRPADGPHGPPTMTSPAITSRSQWTWWATQ